MPFKSDKQRKAVMAKLNQGSTRSNIRPQITLRMTPRLTKTEREFIGKKIRKNIKEGKPRKQAIAIGFSQARAKFGKARIPKLENQKTDFLDKRTRNLLITFLGFNISLSILRSARK